MKRASLCFSARPKQSNPQKTVGKTEVLRMSESSSQVAEIVTPVENKDSCSGPGSIVDPLLCFEHDVQAVGLIGEEKNARIILLAAISARLGKPLNVSVHGTSSAGKNHLTGTVAKFIPADMKKMLSGMSPKTLMHSAEDEFKHKAIFIAEYEGVAGADFAIRTFQSEQVIEWEFVEQVKDKGLKKRTNRVNGPAAFIQATTRATLHPENETRLLFVEVDESEEQTRAINERQAREAAGEIIVPDAEILNEWHGFISNLTTTAVVIPFAPKLAKHFPSYRVRSRRDFPKLLGLVEVSAYLHQHQRERDAEGRIVASCEDYEIAKELFAHSYYAGPEKAVSVLLKEAKALQESTFLGQGDFAAADLFPRTGWGKTRGYEILRRAEELGGIVEGTARGRYKFIHGGTELPLDLPLTVDGA
ncbi:MAG: hypothetical protein WCE61_10725 [Candidatus Acidiferrum sp.]